jgi:hypothetical protein
MHKATPRDGTDGHAAHFASAVSVRQRRRIRAAQGSRRIRAGQGSRLPRFIHRLKRPHDPPFGRVGVIEPGLSAPQLFKEGVLPLCGIWGRFRQILALWLSI